MILRFGVLILKDQKYLAILKDQKYYCLVSKMPCGGATAIILYGFLVLTSTTKALKYEDHSSTLWEFRNEIHDFIFDP